MQSVRHYQYLVLTSLFVLAGGFLATADAPHTQSARWPTQDSVFAVDRWTMGPLQSEMANSIQYVTRHYRSTASGAEAVFSLVTSPEAKRVYRAGAEVPFLGNGYTVAPEIGRASCRERV